jgi:hypothetical protein
MEGRRRDRTVSTSIALVVLAAAFAGWLLLQGPVMVPNKVQGAIGVILGLYICSHPVARILNVLLFDHRPWLGSGSKGAVAWWLGLNLVVLVAGWVVIVMGTTRFVGPTR